MNYTVMFLCILGVLGSSSAVSISKCKAEDSACIQQSAQAFVPILAVGIPEYGVKSLDPLHIPKIEGTSTELKLSVSDTVVKGMKGCTIPAISRDPSHHKLNVDVLCTVDVQGTYSIKGKVLVLPIDGTGHLSVQLSKILISVKSHLKDVERDGKKYWDIDNWDFTWDIKDKANIDLVGLFGGSPELTESMRKLVGQSSTEIVKEVGPPIVKAITSEVVEGIRQFYNHVPVQDLALD